MKNKIMYLFVFVGIACVCGSASGFQKFGIDFTYITYSGDFYVSGAVSFPPGAVKSENNVLVKAIPKEQEVPTFVNVLEQWSDGSIMTAEVMFVANVSRKAEYSLFYGEEIKREKRFSKTAVLPTVSFAMAGLPKISEEMNLDVGEINVTVDKSSAIRYYGYAIPIAIIIFLTYFRFLKARKPYEN